MKGRGRSESRCEQNYARRSALVASAARPTATYPLLNAAAPLVAALVCATVVLLVPELRPSASAAKPTRAGLPFWKGAKHGQCDR